MARQYPPLATLLELEGRSTIQCKVSRTGALGDCKVVAEAPAGVGFGRAALLIAPHFKMKPMSLDGAPVEGGEVTVPIRWLLPGRSDEPAGGPPPPAPRSAQALALARRAAAVTSSDTLIAGQVEQLVSNLQQAESQSGGVVNTPERDAAYDAIRQAFSNAGPAAQERTAAHLAAAMSEQDLAQTVAFLESPAGRTWIEQGRELERSQTSRDLLRGVREDAAKRFCARVKCPPPIQSTVTTSAEPAPSK